MTRKQLHRVKVTSHYNSPELGIALFAFSLIAFGVIGCALIEYFF